MSLIRKIDTRPGDVALIPGDVHFKTHDAMAMDLMLDVAQAFRVNTGVWIGDTFDSVGIARHPQMRKFFKRKHHKWAGTIKEEAEAARPYFERLEAIILENRGDRPGGKHVLEGNHENWWAEIQGEYPGLDDTHWYELYGDLLDGWHIYDESTSLQFGPLVVCHGHRLKGSLNKHSAATVLSRYPGQNTLYGHTHRVDACITPSYKYGLPVDHGAWTIGHMRDIPSMLKDPFLGPLAESHRQGFALVFFHEVAGELRFNVNQVTIDRAANGLPYCIVGGVLFE